MQTGNVREVGEVGTNREKVIKDLEECLSASCRGFRPRLSCPYNDEEWNIMRDALELIKEQEAAYQGAVELLRQKSSRIEKGR